MHKVLCCVLTIIGSLCPTTGFGQSQAQKHFALLERAVESIELSRKTLKKINALKDELKREYQENDKEPATDTLAQQATIALYYGELDRLSFIAEREVKPPIEPREMERSLQEYFRQYAVDDGSGVLALPGDLGELFLQLEQRLAKSRVDSDRSDPRADLFRGNRRAGPRINPRLRMRRMFDGPYSFRDYSVDLSSKSGEETVVGEGAFAKLRKPLQQLLKLSWDDDRWTIDQTHWDDLFQGKSRQQIFGEVKELLAARGVELPPLDQPRPRVFGRRGDGWAPANEQPKVVHLFGNLTSYLQERGSHYSGGNPLRMHSYGSDVEVSLFYDNDSKSFEFRISEFDGAQRTLVVRQDEEDRMQILMLGDRFVRIDQDPSGTITVLDSSPERNRQFRESSAALLSKKHADYLRDELFPLLDEMGILVSSMR